MGDFESVLNRLHLSDVNTILLVALIIVLRSVFSRIDQLERIAHQSRRSVAFIKGRLCLIEEDDE